MLAPGSQFISILFDFLLQRLALGIDGPITRQGLGVAADRLQGQAFLALELVVKNSCQQHQTCLLYTSPSPRDCS